MPSPRDESPLLWRVRHRLRIHMFHRRQWNHAARYSAYAAVASISYVQVPRCIDGDTHVPAQLGGACRGAIAIKRAVAASGNTGNHAAEIRRTRILSIRYVDIAQSIDGNATRVIEGGRRGGSAITCEPHTP